VSRAVANGGPLSSKEDTMNLTTLCTTVVLSIYSAPGGVVVGTVPAYKAVQIDDVSWLRDMVFISKPGPDGSSPRGWIQYGGLGRCRT
jgi:hypothetical protein